MPVTEVTEWCVPIMEAPIKGTDCIKMHMDLSRLNYYVRRELPIPIKAVTDIATEEAKPFTVLDAMKPYQQHPLDIVTLTIHLAASSILEHHIVCRS